MNQFHFVFNYRLRESIRYSLPNTSKQILSEAKKLYVQLTKKGTLGNLTKQRKIKRIANIKVEVVKCMQNVL